MAVHQVAHRFTTEDYERMIDAGVFVDSGRIELWDGKIVEMTPIGLAHEEVVDRLTRLCTTALGDRAIVKVQGSVRIDERSQPQPDIAVLAMRDDFYRHRRPGPPDIALLIEVADSSLAYDLNVKIPRYGVAEVAEGWVVDIGSEVVHVFTDPTPTGYASIRVAGRRESVAPRAYPDALLAVDDIFGPPRSD